MHEIQTLSSTFTAPSTWDEVTRDQILFLIRLMDGTKEYDEIIFCVFVEFFKLPTEKLTYMKHARPNRYADYCADVLIAAQGLFDFLFEKAKIEDGEMLIISKKLTRQLLPEYNGLYGPRSGLSNITIWEFTIAEAAFMDFVDGKEPTALDKLIATLYRPPRSDIAQWRQSDAYNLDDRRVFNDQLIEHDMLLVADWNTEIKTMIFLFFFSCREALQTLFPKIYQNRLKKKGGKAASWADVILQQAREEKGEADKIAERNMMTFLRQRELDIEDAEFQQDEMDKITNKNRKT